MRAAVASGWSPNSCATWPRQPSAPSCCTVTLIALATAPEPGASDRCRLEANSAGHRASPAGGCAGGELARPGGCRRMNDEGHGGHELSCSSLCLACISADGEPVEVASLVRARGGWGVPRCGLPGHWRHRPAGGCCRHACRRWLRTARAWQASARWLILRSAGAAAARRSGGLPVRLVGGCGSRQRGISVAARGAGTRSCQRAVTDVGGAEPTQVYSPTGQCVPRGLVSP